MKKNKTLKRLEHGDLFYNKLNEPYTFLCRHPHQDNLCFVLDSEGVVITLLKDTKIYINDDNYNFTPDDIEVGDKFKRNNVVHEIVKIMGDDFLVLKFLLDGTVTAHIQHKNSFTPYNYTYIPAEEKT